MNHLAHCYLSFHQPDVLVGNFIGDTVKGTAWQRFDPSVQRGILLHRAIDAFTDTHIGTHHLITQLRPFAGKYAGPVSDIVRDFLLANCWESFSDEGLNTFAMRVYTVLTARITDIPEPLRERVPRMIAGHFLTGYGTIEGMRFVLERFEKRMKLPLDREGLLNFIGEERESLCEDFMLYFPQLVQHAQEILERL